MQNFNFKLAELLASGKAFILVSVIGKNGSIPSSVGAKMIVTDDGYNSGTIGGGALENKAISYAKELLVNKNAINSHKVCWNLATELNMLCSGEIELFFDCINQVKWQITVFGAGHVSQSLIKILNTVDCSLTCVDSRDEWLKMLPQSAKIKSVNSCDFTEIARNLDKNSFVLIMTHSHDTDWEVLKECSKYELSYLGMLGSKSKKKWMETKFEQENLDKTILDKIHCPMGLPIGNNSPAEIAVSISAQLLQERDKQAVL